MNQFLYKCDGCGRNAWGPSYSELRRKTGVCLTCGGRLVPDLLPRAGGIAMVGCNDTFMTDNLFEDNYAPAINLIGGTGTTIRNTTDRTDDEPPPARPPRWMRRRKKPRKRKQ